MTTTTTLITLLTATLAPQALDSTTVTRRDVTFRSGGVALAGHLYLPDGYDGSAQLPGVVVTGAWTTVKEQMAGTYAAELAGRGFAALTFDFRGWGASEGAPRFLEDPERKTQDIIAAAAFLAGRPEVNAARVAGLGVCASSGYMADAARRSSDIRALGLVAPWLHDRAIAESVYGGLEGVTSLIAAGRAAAAGSEPTIIEAASTTNEDALMYQAPYYTEPDRGLIDAYDNRFDVASWEPWLTYDAIRVADLLRKPTFAVHSQAAVIPQGITQFAERMGAFAEVMWLEDVGQFDFYDQPEPVAKAADAVAAHFTRVFETQVDVAAVASVIEGVTTLVDLGRLEELETLYAEQVTVDYESLTGEPPATIAARELVSSWASVLPGFDRTRHVLDEVHVVVNGDSAVATADVVADHFVGQLFWQVSGSYRFGLARIGGAWRIERHTLDVSGESGTRDAMQVAAGKAAERPASYVTRERTQAAVRSFLESLESKDMKAFASVWAKDAVQELPFAPEGFPKEVRGRDALIEHYSGWPETSGEADFTSALVFHSMQDPEWVFATFAGKVEIVTTGRLYEQTYGGLFRVVDGEIALFHEYFDPAPFRYAFVLDER